MPHAQIGRSRRSILNSSTWVTVQTFGGFFEFSASESNRIAALSKNLKVKMRIFSKQIGEYRPF